MAKSIDRCIVGDCSNVCMKGSDECSACAYIPEPLPSMDECYGNERSCLVENCFNTPKMFELVCDSCVEKHESSDIPGFPSEYEDDDKLSECGSCPCGNSCVVTSYNRYNICLSCMRQLIDSFGRENKTDAEEALWEHFLPTEDMGWIDIEYAVQRWINVFFFAGDEYEYYIPKEVVDGLRLRCECGKNYEAGCNCLPF